MLSVDKIKEMIMKEYDLVIEGHQSYINYLVVTRDGKFIISGSSDQTIRIWRVPDLFQLAILRGHKSKITIVEVSCDSKYIVSYALDKTIRTWNIEAGYKQVNICKEELSINCLTITKDNTFIISGLGAIIKIWQLQSLTHIKTLISNNSQINAILLNNNNQLLFSGSSDGKVIAWNLKNYNWEFNLDHIQQVHHLAISSNDKYLISGSWYTVIWDLENKIKIREIANYHIVWTYIQFIENNNFYYAVASDNGDNKVRLWNIQENKKINECQCNYNIKCIAFLPNSKLFVSCPKNDSISIWDYENKSEFSKAQCHHYGILGIAISSDNSFAVSGGEDSTLRIWNLKQKHQEYVYQNINPINSISITKDNKYIVSGYKAVVRVFKFQRY